MLIVGEIVKPSGKGRTATWEGMVGTVTRVSERSVVVRWHDAAIDAELDVEEVVSTNTFHKMIQHHAGVLDGSDGGKLLLTFYDDDEKHSS